MLDFNLHKLEKSGKRFFLKLTLFFWGSKSSHSFLRLSDIKKVLIFRLDERIGNGLLLLPLINGIQNSSPDIEIDVLVHHPVANLFRKYHSGQFMNIWPYHQKKLLYKPWNMLRLIKKLRRQQFDLVINCTNPDDFSTSQALFGKILKGKLTAGFYTEKEGNFVNDIQVKSTTQKHYSDAMLDLWRHFDRDAKYFPAGLVLAKSKMPQQTGKILFWLGATHGKELSFEILNIVMNEIESVLGIKVDFALGPADRHILNNYPEKISKRVIFWSSPLDETVLFFHKYKIFISTDTGPMHLAAAFNLPTISIFTKVNIEQYGYSNGKTQFSLLILEEEKELNKLKEQLHRTFELLKKNLNLSEV